MENTGKMVIRELKARGNLIQHQQYIRVAYLPKTDKMSEKFSIEVGKVLDDGTYSKPTSFRSSIDIHCLMIIEALMQAYLMMGGDPMDLRRSMNRAVMRMRGFAFKKRRRWKQHG